VCAVGGVRGVCLCVCFCVVCGGGVHGVCVCVVCLYVCVCVRVW
jgi:hypothetical protein